MERKRRSITGSIVVSEKVARLTDTEALLFSWLLLKPDDEGRMEGSASSVKWRVFPSRSTSVTKVDAMLDKLADVGLIYRYTVDREGVVKDYRRDMESVCKVYLEIAGFDDHNSFHGIQKVPSDIPEYPLVNRSRLTSPPSTVDQSTGPDSISIVEVKRSKDKLREEEVVGDDDDNAYAEFIVEARRIYGWPVDDHDGDYDFFKRLASDYDKALIMDTIEDLRLYQEAPTKKTYKNLRLTLRNWTKRAAERKEANGPNTSATSRRVGYKAAVRRNSSA